MKEHIGKADWEAVTRELHDKGYAIIPGVLTPQECTALTVSYSDAALYRKTISMERYRFGAGEYKYFRYPLPPLIQQVREEVYPRLAPVANSWMKALNIPRVYPLTHGELLAECKAAGQDKPTVLILQYGQGGHNTLHQDLYGDVFFPFQLVLFLSQPGQDHTGGEFVLVEQRPRAQSKAIVLQPGRGDMLIFTTNFRPVQGSKGYYRVNMKHGVSEIIDGHRHTLGIIFHDAQ
ncbi:2OG-Fe(II) oxygenase [Chitinophaga barathri]|uniref:Prolyl 4-hydroxylase subunit alpha n=1 Tax=Chitinophaga barathri TaxID=1647451 RepID=A0A3N4MCW5_9BACT|nr:2OG-Fe(II) oxygenase [Chitinophaga barathri]RPD39756.1 prolyl 4-hydroxylase subunit alpha [Chitinophaga barathri]